MQERPAKTGVPCGSGGGADGGRQQRGRTIDVGCAASWRGAVGLVAAPGREVKLLVVEGGGAAAVAS